MEAFLCPSPPYQLSILPFVLQVSLITCQFASNLGAIPREHAHTSSQTEVTEKASKHTAATPISAVSFSNVTVSEFQHKSTAVQECQPQR